MRWSVLTALIFISAAQLGCANSSPEAVILWHAYRGDEAKALEETVNAYRQRPNAAHVRLVAVPYDAFANKLRVAVPRGNGPDLFIFAHARA